MFRRLVVHIFTSLPWRSPSASCGAFAHSPFAAPCRPLRDNEQRAQSLGYDTFAEVRLLRVDGRFIGYAGGCCP